MFLPYHTKNQPHFQVSKGTYSHFIKICKYANKNQLSEAAPMHTSTTTTHHQHPLSLLQPTPITANPPTKHSHPQRSTPTTKTHKGHLPLLTPSMVDGSSSIIDWFEPWLKVLFFEFEPWLKKGV